jgi:hypothetical protein
VSDYGWTTGRSGFDPRQRQKNFSSILYVQTGSGAHPTSCTMGTGGPFPGGKARPGRDADHSPHLVPRSRMSRSYTSSPPSASMACSRTALPLNIIPPCILGTLHIHVSSAAWTIGQFAVVVQKHSLTPSTWTTVRNRKQRYKAYIINLSTSILYL